MVSGVPKPQVLAICAMVRLVVSSSAARRVETDGLDVTRGSEADLGLEHPGELTFGEVELPGERGNGEVVGEVVA